VYTVRFFSLQNAVCFIILTYLVPVLFTFYIQGVLKLKKNNSGAKRLIKSNLLYIWYQISKFYCNFAVFSIFLTLVAVLINELISPVFLITNTCVLILMFWCPCFFSEARGGGVGELHTRVECGVKLLDTGRNTLKFKCHATSTPLSMCYQILRIFVNQTKYYLVIWK